MISESEKAANKSLVQEFYDQVFSQGDTSNLDRFMRNDYIQHNPTCADGKAGFLEFIKGFLSLGPQIDIIRLNGEDDMVYVFFKCTLKNGHVNKVCDIYRLQDGQLAEHWDIIEHNVEGIQSRNGNGLF